MYYSINNNAKQGDVDCDQKSYTTQPGQVISFDGQSSIVRLVSNRYYDSTNHIVYGDGNCSSGLTYRYNPQNNNEIITFQKELSKKEPQYYCINENINNCHSL
jgi:hypothetical protein